MHFDFLDKLHEGPWRIVDVPKIIYFKNGFYDLRLDLQPMDQSLVDSVRNNTTNLKDLKAFEGNYTMEGLVNVEYARCFIIGSIWEKHKPVILPRYFGQFRFNRDLFQGVTPFTSRIDEYIEESFVARGTNNYIYPAEVSVYKFSEPKRFRIGREGFYFSTQSKEAKKAHFVCFYNYEIFRYFMTAKGNGTLNHRVLASGAGRGKKLVNQVYDPNKSRSIDGQNLVYLKESPDMENLHLIGSIAYDQNFKSNANHVCVNVRNSNSRSFREMRLPLTSNSSMSVSAKWVRGLEKDENGEEIWGLLVFEIQGATNVWSIPFLPVLQEYEVNYEGDDKMVVKSNVQRMRNTRTNNYKNDPIKPDKDTNTPDTTLFELMNPEFNLPIPKPKIEFTDSEGNLRLIDKQDFEDNFKSAKVGPTGTNADPGGKRLKFEIAPLNHFPFFEEIIQKSKLNLQEHFHKVQTKYFNGEGYFINNWRELEKTFKNSSGQPDSVKYGVIHFELNSGYHFYVFEKEYHPETAETRTWIMALPGFRKLKEGELDSFLNEYLFRENSQMKIREINGITLAFSERCNHMHVKAPSKIVSFEDLGRDQDEAIESHAERISEKIKKCVFNSNK